MRSRCLDTMRNLYFIALLICGSLSIGCSSVSSPDPPETSSVNTSVSDDAIARAFDQHKDLIQVEGQGVVRRLLSDDNSGSRHQRFVVALSSGQTLLISHNIDLASRVVGLQEGDVVSFCGEYAWNPEGGVIHWTHRDPRNRHAPGWIKHNGSVYQ
jgi:hypothetical protein